MNTRLWSLVCKLKNVSSNEYEVVEFDVAS